MSNNRSRVLLDLAHEVHSCTNCGRWADSGCEPAHENGIAAGKGQSIKGQDNRHAALCHACHSWYDTASNGMDPSASYLPDRLDKAAMWNRAHKRTFDLYWQNGWLKVK